LWPTIKAIVGVWKLMVFYRQKNHPEMELLRQIVLMGYSQVSTNGLIKVKVRQLRAKATQNES
jgi:hypothetical protein